MGKDRNSRRKAEGTFLESIKSSLALLHDEVLAIKLAIGDLKVDSPSFVSCTFLPPPAPPPFDYDRGTLLACRTNMDKSLIGISVPRTVNIADLRRLESTHWTLEQAGDTESPAYRVDPQNLTDYAMAEERTISSALSAGAKEFMPSAVCVDYDSLCFTLDEEDLEQYTEYGGHVEKNVHRDKNSIIAEAQHKARTSRFRENWAINRIQFFWRACKTKMNTSRQPSSHIVEVPSRNGVRRGAFSLASASNLAGKSSLTKSDLLWQIELLNERNANDHWSREESNRTESDTSSANVQPLRGTDAFDLALLSQVSFPKEVNGLVAPILEMAIKLDTETRAAYIFKATRGIFDRHKIPEEIYFEVLSILEASMACEMSNVLPFVCVECSWRHECQKALCELCGGEEVFNEREYIESEEYKRYCKDYSGEITSESGADMESDEFDYDDESN